MSTTSKALCDVYLAYIVKLSLHEQVLFQTRPGDRKNPPLLRTSHMYEMRLIYNTLNYHLNY